MLYLITKLQNLKAIHNGNATAKRGGGLYLITKLQNLKAIHNALSIVAVWNTLYLITKLQNLKAIHNNVDCGNCARHVVSNYKITKSESYSQQRVWHMQNEYSCI